MCIYINIVQYNILYYITLYYIDSLILVKGQMGSALMGSTANDMFLDRGIFWVLPLSYCYVPKSARAYLFPQSVKIHHFCSGPISVDPKSTLCSSLVHHFCSVTCLSLLQRPQPSLVLRGGGAKR